MTTAVRSRLARIRAVLTEIELVEDHAPLLAA